MSTTLRTAATPKSNGAVTTTKSAAVNAAARTAKPTPNGTSKPAPKKSGLNVHDAAIEVLDRTRSCSFICDPECKIVFANEKSFEILTLMEPNLSVLEGWKGFRAADVVGTSLEFLFTDAPGEFRKATDPRYLPYNNRIRTGPCTCDVQVTALNAPDGQFLGFAVDWERITDKLAQERRVKQLMQVLEESCSNTILCDLQWNVLYANKKSFDILEFMEPNLHKHNARMYLNRHIYLIFYII